MAALRLQRQHIPALLVVFSLTTPLAYASPQQQQSTAAAPQTNSGTTSTQPAAPGQNPAPLQNSQQTAEPPQAIPPPQGVAVAPVIHANGVSASEPSGVAIAPAKQKRRFSLALRVGLIVGAAIAVGAVTAASLASPSRPHTTP